MQKNLIIKKISPGLESWWNILKDQSIPLLPDMSHWNETDFEEPLPSKINPFKYHHLKELQCGNAGNSQMHQHATLNGKAKNRLILFSQWPPGHKAQVKSSSYFVQCLPSSISLVFHLSVKQPGKNLDFHYIFYLP